MKRGSVTNNPPPDEEPNVAPLIDIVFILLIFFVSNGCALHIMHFLLVYRGSLLRQVLQTMFSHYVQTIPSSLLLMQN